MSRMSGCQWSVAARRHIPSAEPLMDPVDCTLPQEPLHVHAGPTT